MLVLLKIYSLYLKFMQFTLSKTLLYWSSVVVLGLLVGFSIQLAQAWVSPTLPPPNGNIGLRQYVSDCNQFAANGWASKNECLTDGRWHVVQSVNGMATADLKAAIVAGAEVRIATQLIFPGINFSATRECINTFIYNDGFAYCQQTLQYGGSILDDAPSNDPMTPENDTDWYAFNGSDPRLHQTWAKMGVGVFRSDGDSRSIEFHPGADGNTRSVPYMKVGNSSWNHNIQWYVRY
jgi:hypothetical protein